MAKKLKLIILIVVVTFFTTGCWNYVGLNEMTAVSGLSIDKKDGKYLLTFEIFDLQNSTIKEPIKSKLIESTGKTIFDAVRNAKKRIANKLYFSNARVVIISEEVAKDGLKSIMDWFIRDPEIRETLGFVISKEKKAATILKNEGLYSNIVSNDIYKIITKDQLITSTTEFSELYKTYNTLNSEGISLTLPVIKISKNDNKKISEVDGIAIFKKDKLIGYLNSLDTKYYLMAKSALKGGIIALNIDEKTSEQQEDNISLEVKKSSSKIKYTSKKNNNLKVTISINTKVTLGELDYKKGSLNEKDLVKIEKLISKDISKKVKKVISKIQTEYQSDILGLGNILYKEDYKTWKKYKKNWDNRFKKIEVTVKAKVKILNTGFIK